jgi:3-hydroxyisobutyrate dehydrogenase
MTTPPVSTTSTDRPMVQRVGFIGLGDQGAPMAEMILRRGFALDVWARRREAAAPLAALGATVRGSAAELGAGCDVVGLCVVDDAGVTDVAVDQGLLDAMQPGSTLLIHSTVAPATCDQLAAKGRARGVDVLDAPVSGGRAAALRGALSVMVGGDPDAIARVHSVLASYGDPIRHVGSVGAAQAVKLVNNGLFVANVAMAAAALDLGHRLGVDSAMLAEVLSASSGRSAGLEALGPLTTTHWGRHAWTVLRKDVELLGGIKEVFEARSPLVAAAAAALERFAGP